MDEDNIEGRVGPTSSKQGQAKIFNGVVGEVWELCFAEIV